MTVKDVIEQLSKLPPDIYVCGNGDGPIGLFSKVSDIQIATKYHDCIPLGKNYVELEFYNTLKKKPEIVYNYKCRYCDFKYTGTEPIACKKCEWQPMLIIDDKESKDE